MILFWVDGVGTICLILLFWLREYLYTLTLIVELFLFWRLGLWLPEIMGNKIKDIVANLIGENLSSHLLTLEIKSRSWRKKWRKKPSIRDCSENKDRINKRGHISSEMALSRSIESSTARPRLIKGQNLCFIQLKKYPSTKTYACKDKEQLQNSIRTTWLSISQPFWLKNILKRMFLVQCAIWVASNSSKVC